MARRPLRRAAPLVGVLLALTGCIGTEADVERKSHADAGRIVDRYGQDVAAALGVDKLGDFEILPNPCDDKWGQISHTKYSAAGYAQVPMPGDQHLATLARLKDRWQQQGYTVTSYRTHPDTKDGVLTVHNPADGVVITVESTKPPVAVAVFIDTPCYESDEPILPGPIDISGSAPPPEPTGK